MNKDSLVDEPLTAVATTLTILPLEVSFTHIPDQYDAKLGVTITNPTSGGVYVDVNDEVRYYHTTTETITMEFNDGDVLKFYGGAENITFTGANHTVEDWGQFSCSGCNL